MQVERMAGGVDDGAEADDAERAVHGQPQALTRLMQLVPSTSSVVGIWSPTIVHPTIARRQNSSTSGPFCRLVDDLVHDDRLVAVRSSWRKEGTLMRAESRGLGAGRIETLGELARL